MLSSAAVNIFLIVASVCVVLITLMLAAVTVALLIATRRMVRLARQAQQLVEKLHRVERALSWETVFASKWAKRFTRHFMSSTD